MRHVAHRRQGTDGVDHESTHASILAGAGALLGDGEPYDGAEHQILCPHEHATHPRVLGLSAHPRPDFKNRILAAFTDGLRARPDTTFGNVKADVLEHFVPGFERGDFVEIIQGSAWAE